MNHFLKKQAHIQDDIFNAGLRIGFQQAMDFFQLALHDPKIMGKDTLGEERLYRVLTEVIALHKVYDEAFYPKKAEADYMQELLDRKLSEICKKRKIVPFAERYDELKKCSYGRRYK